MEVVLATSDPGLKSTITNTVANFEVVTSAWGAASLAAVGREGARKFAEGVTCRSVRGSVSYPGGAVADALTHAVTAYFDRHGLVKPYVRIKRSTCQKESCGIAWLGTHWVMSDYKVLKGSEIQGQSESTYTDAGANGWIMIHTPLRPRATLKPREKDEIDRRVQAVVESHCGDGNARE